MSKKIKGNSRNEKYIVTSLIMAIVPVLFLYSPAGAVVGSGVEIKIFYMLYALLAILSIVLGAKVFLNDKVIMTRVFAVAAILIGLLALGFSCFFLVLSKFTIPF